MHILRGESSSWLVLLKWQQSSANLIRCSWPWVGHHTMKLVADVRLVCSPNALASSEEKHFHKDPPNTQSGKMSKRELILPETAKPRKDHFQLTCNHTAERWVRFCSVASWSNTETILKCLVICSFTRLDRNRQHGCSVGEMMSPRGFCRDVSNHSAVHNNKRRTSSFKLLLHLCHNLLLCLCFELSTMCESVTLSLL